MVIMLFANKLKFKYFDRESSFLPDRVRVWVIDYQYGIPSVQEQYGIPSVQEMIHIGDYLLAFHKTWQNDMHPIFVIIIRQVHHMSS